MPLAFTEEFNLFDTPKFRTFKGCITEPYILDTKDKPLTIEVTKNNEPISNISGIRQTLSKDTSSALNGKVITNVSFTVDIQRPEIMEFFNSPTRRDYNVTYKLGDGQEITVNGVRFEPVPELPYEVYDRPTDNNNNNNDHSITRMTGAEISALSSSDYAVGLVTDWRVEVPDPSTIKPKKKKKVKKDNKALVPLNEQLKKLFK